jgi:hypothetical protein
MKKVSQMSAIVFLGVFVFLSMGNPVNAITYSSGFQVQNLDSTKVANLQIKYYNQDGTIATTFSTNPLDLDPQNQPVPAGGSRTYSTIHAPTGFNGSVVIESDALVTAIVNTTGDNFTYVASSNGFSSGATTTRLPLLMKGNSGFNTWFNVQNTGSVAATVDVVYSDGTSEPQATIPVGAAKTYDQKNHTFNQAVFIGSGTITSSQPVVATVMQVGDNVQVLLAYNGFTSGSNKIQLPLVQANNSGFFSGVQVQNAGTVPADITITYGPNTVGNGFAPSPQTKNAVNGTSVTFDQNLFPLRYIGGATITSLPAQPMVAIVNQLSLTGKASAYEGIDPSGATPQVVAPLIMANNSNYSTAIQVRNVGTGNCSNVQVVYAPNTVTSSITTPTPDTFTLAPEESKTIFQSGTGQFQTDRYIGSATIQGTGTGCLLAAIINEANLVAAGDQLSTYNAIAK